MTPRDWYWDGDQATWVGESYSGGHDGWSGAQYVHYSRGDEIDALLGYHVGLGDLDFGDDGVTQHRPTLRGALAEWSTTDVDLTWGKATAPAPPDPDPDRTFAVLKRWVEEHRETPAVTPPARPKPARRPPGYAVYSPPRDESIVPIDLNTPVATYDEEVDRQGAALAWLKVRMDAIEAARLDNEAAWREFATRGGRFAWVYSLLGADSVQNAEWGTFKVGADGSAYVPEPFAESLDAIYIGGRKAWLRVRAKG